MAFLVAIFKGFMIWQISNASNLLEKRQQMSIIFAATRFLAFQGMYIHKMMPTETFHSLLYQKCTFPSSLFTKKPDNPSQELLWTFKP